MEKKRHQDQGRRARRVQAQKRRPRTGLFVFLRMALMEKKRHQDQGRRARRVQAQKRRRRTGLFVFVGLAILTLVALIFFGTNLTLQSDNGVVVDRVTDPTVSGAPDAVKKEKASDEEQASEDQASEDQTTDEGSEEPTPVAPDDPTMYLSIPKLGISGALVTGSEAGLESGTQVVSGYPWLPGSNTYIAGHRLGFPGTGSDHIFYNLPSMAPGDEITLTDTNDQVYKYVVSEILQVDPTDLGVLGPTGDDTVSLQTCIEDYGDFTTLGPDWNVRFIVRGDRVA
jgi:sortase A